MIPGVNIQLTDLQELLLHALLPESPAPKWCTLPPAGAAGAAGASRRVVLLLLPGLDWASWTERKSQLPGLASLGAPLRVYGAAGAPTPAAVVLSALTLRSAYAQQRRRGGAGGGGGGGDPTRRRATAAAPPPPEERASPNPFPPSFYCLSPAQLADNNYPLPVAEGAALRCPEGYVVTQPAGGGVAPSHAPPLLALDCEMVSTAAGLQLARCSVVDGEGAVVYDALVRPPGPVTDYHTQHSGITEASLRGVTTCLAEVQAALLRTVAQETLLVGHSLDNDLAVLRLVHRSCVDTALLYPHPRGPPFKPALRVLAERLLGRKIQEGSHDSADDARATMELARLKFARGPAFGEARPEGVALPEVASSAGLRAALVDRPHSLQRIATGAASAIACASDADAAAKAGREAGRAGGTAPDLVVAHLSDLGALQEGRAQRARRRAEQPGGGAGAPGGAEAGDEAVREAEVLARADVAVAAVAAAAQHGTLLVVFSPQGDTAAARRLLESKFRRNQGLGGGPWDEHDEAALAAATDRARNGLVWPYIVQG